MLVEQKKTCKWLSEELGVNPSTVSKWCTNSGHKDGAVFTPGFVTMYMAHEAVRRTIIQKFNNPYKEWNCQTEIDLYNRLSHIDVKEANSVFNSIKICDPASHTCPKPWDFCPRPWDFIPKPWDKSGKCLDFSKSWIFQIVCWIFRYPEGVRCK